MKRLNIAAAMGRNGVLIQKGGASAAFALMISRKYRSGLRRRREAGIGVRLPVRTAGRGYWRTARIGRRVVVGLAHWRDAIQHAADFIAGQGFIFEQPLGEGLEIDPLLGDDAAGYGLTHLHETP